MGQICRKSIKKSRQAFWKMARDIVRAKASKIAKQIWVPFS